ncbi:hypothetical protein [Actinomadura coerulea]|uniref:hypothetical protein n=1 Tax=Actinomadura coerulea TaxID=46159 RepID=UPI00342F7019
MPIANPFQNPDRPDRDGGPAEGADAGPVPASFGKPERRPDERDRPRTRTRKGTGNTAQKAAVPPHGGGQGPARDGGPAEGPDAAEDASAPHAETGPVLEPGAEASGGPGGEVVPLFPGAGADAASGRGELVPAALAEAARVWWAEVSVTVHQALDGSVYRARPPALRDSAVRLQRTEWSGGMPLLRWAGWIYGYPALAVRAVLMGALWLLDHPTRLIVLAGVIAAALYL